MLTCFNLRDGVTIDEFRAALNAFHEHLVEGAFVHATGPVGQRQRHEVMDTDDERDHEYFFIMTFRDRAQCDRAVEYIYRHDEPAESIHHRVYEKIADPVFICWEDVE